MADEVALGLHGGTDGFDRRWKGGEERVAFGADFDAAVSGDCLAQNPRVSSEQVFVLGPERGEQPRRALDVGKQEGDRADR